MAICSSNLDEFFQVRISALKDQVAGGVAGSSTGGLTPSQQLAAIGPNVEGFVIEQEKVLLDILVPELAQQRRPIDRLGRPRCRRTRCISSTSSSSGSSRCSRRLAVDPAHPFPYISNLALSLAAMVSDPDTGERRFARVKVPTVFPRLMAPARWHSLRARRAADRRPAAHACSSGWWSRSTRCSASPATPT